MRLRYNCLITMLALAIPQLALSEDVVIQPDTADLIALPSIEAQIPSQAPAPVLNSKRSIAMKPESYRIRTPNPENTGSGARLLSSKTSTEATTTTVDRAEITSAAVSVTVGDLPGESNQATPATQSFTPKNVPRRTYAPPQPVIGSVRPQSRYRIYTTRKPTPTKANSPYDRLRQRNRPGGRR